MGPLGFETACSFIDAEGTMSIPPMAPLISSEAAEGRPNRPTRVVPFTYSPRPSDWPDPYHSVKSGEGSVC